MLTGLKESLNPKGGHGVWETIVIIAIVVSVLVMNILQIEVIDIVQNAFVAIIAYLVGTNAKKGGGNDDENSNS